MNRYQVRWTRPDGTAHFLNEPEQYVAIFFAIEKVKDDLRQRVQVVEISKEGGCNVIFAYNMGGLNGCRPATQAEFERGIDGYARA